uniref:Uncharacterized protein n=1 Tax=Avena sativa TaxID=4498 RepID=A0ACD5VZ78_AVESA
MDWSGLPLDVLIEIAVRLTVADWLSFGDVCTAWKQAAETASSSGLRPKQEPPWLMLAGGGADLAVADFMSLSDGRRRSIALPKPAIQKRAWFGSANGWLVTVDDECALHLLNPITGAQLPLPSISTMGFFQVLPRNESNKVFRVVFDRRSFQALHFPGLDHSYLLASPEELPADDFLVTFVRRAVPWWDPITGDYFVLMIHGPSNKLAFTRERDTKWVVLPSKYHYNDAILYRGHFYTVTDCGLVQVWEPDGATFRPRLAAPKHAGIHDFTSYPYLRKYLAESPDGRLMIIWRERSSVRDSSESEEEEEEKEDDEHDDPMDNDAQGYNSPHRSYNEDCVQTLEPADPTVLFRVFVLDERPGGSQWTEVDDLGGATLFIGYNSAVFFPNDRTPGLLADCIYFTEDHYVYSWRRKHKPRDMGVFDMKTSMVKPIHLFSDEHYKSWPPPIWITPCI